MNGCKEKVVRTYYRDLSVSWLSTNFFWISEHSGCRYMVSLPQISEISRAAQDDAEKLLRGTDTDVFFSLPKRTVHGTIFKYI